MSIFLFIPARMGSSRFPGKPLFKLFGKPMIQWIYEASIKSKADKVYITTPDKEIINFCKSMNYPFIKTSVKHERCLDRIGEAYEYIEPKEESDILVCMQGDEPLVTTNMINKLIDFHLKGQYEFVVSALKINEEEFLNKNIVKAYVKNISESNYVDDFDRRFDIGKEEFLYHHVGIYGYKRKALEAFVGFDQSKAEIERKLEQMRAIENGMKIVLGLIDELPISVDTQEDLEIARISMDL